MFEGIVASLLNRYLSNYIDEVDYNNLKLGIFSGTLELLNIKVKPSALYQFDLPVDVKYGKIGKLKINISWKNILTKPAVAHVEDLFVLLAPFEDKINDPKKIEEMLISYKRKQLQEFEKFDKAEIYETKEKGFAEKAQDTIINNIQVYVKNIHIRYEDKHSITNKIISFGLYFKEFRAETVDADGKPNFLTSDEKTIYKKGTLVGFNSYWNYGEDRRSLIILEANDTADPKQQKWSTLLKESIDTGMMFDKPFAKFMENNLDLDVRLTLRRSHQSGEDIDKPKITFESSLMSLGFVFQRQQYKSILQIVDYYSLLSVHKKFVKYRPKEFSKDRKEKSKQLWNFAFTALAESTWRSYKKERMLNHWKYYKIYIQKYEQKILTKQKDKQLDPKDVEYLEFLEKILTLESILDVRNMLKQKHKIKTDNEPENKEVAITKQPSFDQRPLNYIEFRFVLNLPFITLKFTNASYVILKATFANISSMLEVRPVSNSVYFLVNMQAIQLDGVYYKESLKSSPNRLVPIIKSANSIPTESPSTSSLATNYQLPVEEASHMLFTFCFETNPTQIDNVEFRVKAKCADSSALLGALPLAAMAAWLGASTQLSFVWMGLMLPAA